MKVRTGCQYVGYFYYSEHLNWAAQNLRLGHMRPAGRGLDIAALSKPITIVNIRANKNCNDTIINQCKQSGVLCHIGLVRDHGGHLVNQPTLFFSF